MRTLLLLAQVITINGDTLEPYWPLSLVQAAMYVDSCVPEEMKRTDHLGDVFFYKIKRRPSLGEGFAHWADIGAGSLIVIHESRADDWRVVAHELVHHLVKGPPGAVPHPMNPFWFPCKLMPKQWAKGEGPPP